MSNGNFSEMRIGMHLETCSTDHIYNSESGDAFLAESDMQSLLIDLNRSVSAWKTLCLQITLKCMGLGPKSNPREVQLGVSKRP